MGKLEEQLQRANRKASAEQRRDPPKGGPVDGGPHDRWIAYHATLGARSATLLVTILCVVLMGLVAVALAFSGMAMSAAIVGSVGAVPIAIAWTIYLSRRAGAAAKQRAYLSTLPFTFDGYLESMRQPKWWTRWSYAVIYYPKLVVTWHSPPGDEMIGKLATLAAARFDGGIFEPTSSSVSDPWRWARGVVDEVLTPLREKSEVATAELKVKRAAEYQSSGD